MDSKDTKSVKPRSPVLLLYRELWKQAQGSRGALLGAMLLLTGAQVVLLAVPYFIGKAFNELQAEGGMGTGDAAMWLFAVLGATLVSWLMHGPGRILERNVSLDVRKRIATELTERLLAFPLSWHDGNHSVASAYRVQQSSKAVGIFAESQYVYLSSAIRLVAPLGALLLIHPAVGAVATVGLLVICWSVTRFDRAIVRLAIQTNDAERRYTATLTDALGSATTVLALRQARPFIVLLQQLVENIRAPLKRLIVISEGKWCAVDIASRLLNCLLVGMYAWLALRSSADGRHLLLGNVYMVWEYAIQASAVIAAVATNFQAFATQYADFESADIIRDTPIDESRHAPTARHAWHRCDIRDIVFHHAGSRGVEPALNVDHLALKRGKRYALIGGSGSGKSTLMRVLAGLYVAERIVVDSAEGGKMDTSLQVARFFRGSTTLIPQDADLFEASLADNLAMCEALEGQPSPDHYRRVLDLATVTEFIGQDVEAAQVRIAENATNWSGGQRARVALARGVLAAHGSSLILLDEPTASLDAKTEAAVYGNIFHEFADACLMVSVHRLDMLKHFDEVLVMDRGRIVAQGHESVLAAGSREYAELRAALLKDPQPDGQAKATVP